MSVFNPAEHALKVILVVGVCACYEVLESLEANLRDVRSPLGPPRELPASSAVKRRSSDQTDEALHAEVGVVDVLLDDPVLEVHLLGVARGRTVVNPLGFVLQELGANLTQVGDDVLVTVGEVSEGRQLESNLLSRPTETETVLAVLPKDVGVEQTRLELSQVKDNLLRD